MAFQLKDFVSIAASMINRAKATQDKITDFNIGSVARTLMESTAIEVEEFYQRMFAGILEAIPTAIYKGFDFVLQDAAAARGVVQISFGVPIEEAFTIPAGTIFVASTTNNRYLSVQSVAVPVGVSEISVLVECSVSGTVGNAVAGVINTAQGFDLPTNAVVSNLPITSGQDAETEDERKARFVSFIQTLARGTNGAVEFAARSAQIANADGTVVEYVTRVGFIEVPGTMDVFIYGANQTASAALIAEAQKLIDGYWDENAQTYVPGYRPVGIRVRVFNMDEQQVDATFTVEMWPGVSFSAAVQADVLTRIVNEIGNVDAGGVLYVENLINAALGAAGVRAVRTNLTANILCPTRTALVGGDLNIVEGNA